MPELSLFQRDFAAAVAAAGPTSPLAVYRNTSALGAIEALAANYSTVRRIIGDALFRDMAASFAQFYPPRDPVLATYGSGFAEFVEHHEAGQGLPYLADIARIDCMHIETLFAGDAPPLDPASLRTVDPDGWMQLHLKLHPAARFLWLRSPAMTIWLAHARHGDPDEIIVDWSEGGALTSRPFGTVEACQLDPAGYCLISAIHADRSVGDAALSTLNLYPGADVGALFASFVDIGLFASPTD